MKSKGFNQKDASRITSSTAIKNGGQIPKGSFGAKVQSIVAKSTVVPKTSIKTKK